MSLDLISKEDVIKIIKNAASSCEGTDVSNVFDLVEERINTLARPVCSYIKITNIPDVRENWLTSVNESKNAIVIMEGVSMYLTPQELINLTQSFSEHFEHVSILMDCYSNFAAKMSKYKNPVNNVGVTRLYGIDSPKQLEKGQLNFVKEHTMIPQEYIGELKGFEKHIFAKLYAGSISKKLYRLLEYEK